MASIKKRSDGRWRARYRDECDREHARHFARKVDAQRWLDGVTASIVTGQYVDPKAGRITFQEYAEQWRTAQVHRPTSAAHVEGMLRRHAYPVFGARLLGSILPSEIQVWVKLLGTGDKPTSGNRWRRRRSRWSTPLCPRSSARPSGIARSWQTRVRAPAWRKRRRRVIPLTTAQVETLRGNFPMSSRRSSPSPPAPA